MPKAVTIIRADLTAAGLRQAAACSNAANAARRMLGLALRLEGYSRGEAARLCGMDLQTLRDWVIRYKALLGCPIAPLPVPNHGSLQSRRRHSQRTRPCQGWCGALAPGGSGPRDQNTVQCDPGRAQRWRDAAPARVSALVGAAAPSTTGPGGAGDTQKNFADLVKPRSLNMRANNRLNFGGRTKPGLVSRAH
jgi:hypothetical protein